MAFGPDPLQVFFLHEAVEPGRVVGLQPGREGIGFPHSCFSRVAEQLFHDFPQGLQAGPRVRDPLKRGQEKGQEFDPERLERGPGFRPGQAQQHFKVFPVADFIGLPAGHQLAPDNLLGVTQILQGRVQTVSLHPQGLQQKPRCCRAVKPQPLSQEQRPVFPLRFELRRRPASPGEWGRP